MKEKLLQKIERGNLTFSDKETQWLMKNIGNEDPIIRDNIVFTLLAGGIVEGSFTLQQFNYIKEKTISDDLIFYYIDKKLPYTLKRSFAALLNGFIIQADNESDSPYYNLLTKSERDYFFNTSINYLKKETDKIGFSSDYGWVHAFAHGGDYLSKSIVHRYFDKNKIKDVLSNITFILDSLEEPFKDEEECRIANIIYEALLSGKLEQIMFKEWIETLDFPLEKNKDFYRLATFKHMLAYIYFHSLDKFKLDEELEKIMLVYLKKY